jgi:hypothetical protein
MNACINKNECCENLKILSVGNLDGKSFFGCSLYPECKNKISLFFEHKLMSEFQKNLENAFGLFVRSNNFVLATYGVVYFNLRDAAFMDYLLRSGIVYESEDIEIGLTGAKIFYTLFYHLLLIPCAETKCYLINNFPKSYNNFLSSINKPIFFNVGIDYMNNSVREEVFIKFRDLETYNK